LCFVSKGINVQCAKGQPTGIQYLALTRAEVVKLLLKKQIISGETEFPKEFWSLSQPN